MTDIEKKAYKAYPKEGGKAYHSEFGTIEFDRNAELREGYIKCAEEYESLPKIHGWVARTEKGMLFYYGQKPIRTRRPGWNTWWVEPDVYCASLPSDVFPEITWESEPVEVELLIRKVESTKQV